MNYFDVNTDVTVTMNDAETEAAKSKQPQKERPVWMMESTIEGASNDFVPVSIV